MDPKSKTIITKQMTISDIEKKWHCDTNRAVKLFCKALGIKKPNTDKLDAWSKNKLKKFTGGKNCDNAEEASHGDHQTGCSSCRSCNGSCNC